MFLHLCHSVHGGFSVQGFSVRGVSVRETLPYSNVRAVRILLECILVDYRFKFKLNVNPQLTSQFFVFFSVVFAEEANIS